MWHALRAELVYFRPWLFGALGIASGIVLLMSVLMRFSSDENGPPAFLLVMFPIIAGMVVSFIAGSYRIEEHRARLLLSGALTPRQLAWVTVLLPTCFVGLSLLSIPPIFGLGVLLAGKFEASHLTIAGSFALQFWAYAQLGPLAQESSAARRQDRGRAGLLGWAVFAGVILVLAACQFFLRSTQGTLWQVVVIVVAIGVAVALYQGRTDFTR
jgi:hypothetical protein